MPVHLSTVDLEQQLKRIEGVKYIVVESLYSMDGDFAPLKEIVTLSEKYRTYLVVDEAHAAGVFGQGITTELNCELSVFARLVTFGKSYGSHGAAILGNKELIQYLYNFSRSFIYTTALPPAAYQRIELITLHSLLEERRSELVENITYFRKLMKGVELVSGEKSPIQIIHCGNVQRLTSISEHLYKEGIMVKAIFSPTVPTGKERLRICLHAFNKPHDIKQLVQIIRSYLQ